MDEKGVWRTVGGRRIFIRDGVDLETAMKESGKFNSKKKFKNGYGETSTEDSLGDDSLAKYKDKDGKLLKEREVLHQKIIEEFFEGKSPVSDEEKTFYMTGGGSGTGKTYSFIEHYKEKYMNQPDNTIMVDSDRIKTMFPDFDKNDITSASYFHEESSALAKRILRIAEDNKYNVLLDGTGDGGLKGLRKKITDAKERGYKTRASYATCEIETALQRNQTRYENALKAGKVARKVKEQEVIKTHRDVSRSLPEVADEFDQVDLYDFNDFNNIKHIATGGSGKGLTPMKEFGKEYNMFLDKANLPDWEDK